MNENSEQSQGFEASSNSSMPVIRREKRVSKIWILPFIAAIIGTGMLYSSWQNRGIEISITFLAASGLEVGKTRLKYLDVAVGSVTSLRFDDDREKIIVGVEVDKEMQDLLHEDSKFWVVKPRAGIEGISGIGTLLSGTFIEISKGASETMSRSFIGLETPPVTSQTDPGLHITLISQGGKKLEIGNSVLYRGFEVGKVESFDFDVQKREARYGIFINAPFDDLVNTNTLFWNAGGLSLTTSAQGIKVNLASISTLVTGGVEFNTPDESNIGASVPQDTEFSLHDDEESAINQNEYEAVEYTMLLNGSAKGLMDGASVEYRGIRVGTVSTPRVTLKSFVQGVTNDQDRGRIPVTLKIEPARITQETNVSLEEFDLLFQGWIKNGLSATLKTANYLTGAMYVDLDFDSKAKAEIEMHNGRRVVPSRQSELAGLTEKVENILDMVESLPVNETLASANNALNSTDATIQALNETLAEANKTLAGLQPGSAVYDSLDGTMKKLQSTLDSLEPLIKEVKNKPNSLIFSGSKPADRQPQAQKSVNSDNN